MTHYLFPIPPFPLTSKRVEFIIAFTLVFLLAWFSNGGPPRHRKRRRHRRD